MADGQHANEAVEVSDRNEDFKRLRRESAQRFRVRLSLVAWVAGQQGIDLVGRCPDRIMIRRSHPNPRQFVDRIVIPNDRESGHRMFQFGGDGTCVERQVDQIDFCAERIQSAWLGLIGTSAEEKETERPRYWRRISGRFPQAALHRAGSGRSEVMHAPRGHMRALPLDLVARLNQTASGHRDGRALQRSSSEADRRRVVAEPRR